MNNQNANCLSISIDVIAKVRNIFSPIQVVHEGSTVGHCVFCCTWAVHNWKLPWSQCHTGAQVPISPLRAAQSLPILAPNPD